MAAFFVDLDQNQYSPKDVLWGTVTCMFDAAEKIEGIEINVRGEEHTQWMEKTSSDYKDYKVVVDEAVQYSGCNKFLSRKVNMPGVYFEPGRHVYRFSFELPRKIPGSYSVGDGRRNNSVRYYVRVKIKRAQEKAETVVVKNFDVIAHVYLKNVEGKCHSLERIEHGLVKLNVFLEKNIFLIGDDMIIVVKISNPTRIQVYKITAEVGLNVESTALTPRKESEIEYTLLAKQDMIYPVSDNEREYIFQLKVPENAYVPNFKDCELFKLFSVVKVSAILPTYKDIVLTLPITLGHVILPTDDPSSDLVDTYFYQDTFVLTPGYDHVIHSHHSSETTDPPAPDPLRGSELDPSSDSNTQAILTSQSTSDVGHHLQPGVETGTETVLVNNCSNPSYTPIASDAAAKHCNETIQLTELPPIAEPSAETHLLHGCPSSGHTQAILTSQSTSDVDHRPLPGVETDTETVSVNHFSNRSFSYTPLASDAAAKHCNENIPLTVFPPNAEPSAETHLLHEYPSAVNSEDVHIISTGLLLESSVPVGSGVSSSNLDNVSHQAFLDGGGGNYDSHSVGGGGSGDVDCCGCEGGDGGGGSDVDCCGGGGGGTDGGDCDCDGDCDCGDCVIL